MSTSKISLNDKYDIEKHQVLLNGTQALVRLMIAQKERDRQAGLNTAGYVTGYRGSPLGAVDFQMKRAGNVLPENDIRFQEGLNEDLAATALWGAQQAELRGEGRFDGVFGLWYGKGPGVDRSGDVMRHANMAGSSKNGGVIMAMGDDHTGESSTVLHQSDWAMVDASMPVISPAGVQEILDYGHYGYALSRFAGVWVGLKTMKDTIEVTSVVDGNPHRMHFKTPDIDMPEGGLNIRLVDLPVDQEARLLRHKISAAEAFARENRIDQRGLGQAGAKIGIVAAGKNWLDVQHAMSVLGVDQDEAMRLGITTYKVVQTWPLDKTSLREWADGLDLIIVVEEKRKLIEPQIKDAIFHDADHCRVYGGEKGDLGTLLFPSEGALDPIDIAQSLGQIFVEEGCGGQKITDGLAQIANAKHADNASDIAARLPYFCAGCPHNSSTKVPEGSRAYAGIGCHYMAQWMERDTLGYTHMGAEGANWIGESLFSKRDHVFQNIGDGTYNHSGIQAIRAAVSAGTNITYKILYNDAVAMTGGQGNDGALDAPRIARELQAMGVKKLVVVYDYKEDLDLAAFPSDIEKHERANLMTVQKELREIRGVSAIVYVQTCAAEKRRRRKRGLFPDPDKRIFINTDVCEGCGDCGVQSNCVAITPVETELGRKRAIDQSACNKDFSCVNGFCPSFVTLPGATPKKKVRKSFELPDLPNPTVPTIPSGETFNIIATGVGGTGVVTIGALLAQAAQIDGKGAGMMEMAGLAQKGGAVHVHCRIANSPADISAIRVATGECDALIGGDLVVSSGAKTIGLTSTGRTGAVVNDHEIVTGDFTRDTEFKIPNDRLRLTLEARIKDKLALLDATKLAADLLGDSIYSNMVVFGAAWQMGFIPLSHNALYEAIALNGAKVEQNQRAFEVGRWAAEYPEDTQKLIASEVVALPEKGADKIAYRIDHLRAYQGNRLAKRYQKFLDKFENERLRDAVALGYHKLLTYKDEYEVARLHLTTVEKAKETFDNVDQIRFHLAPPMLGGMDANGRPKKREFGPWMLRSFALLSRLKALRGSPFDAFGYTAERRMERRLIKQFENDFISLAQKINQENMDLLVELALLPLSIRGFGPVKQANEEKAQKRRAEILEGLKHPKSPLQHAAE
ncbi:MAG: indolepyruvate ferredoxin oxidoreductase family protein [Paracoccaceae bacterium]|jgi:indolepyruvate ferredoxin oxidoreductase